MEYLLYCTVALMVKPYTQLTYGVPDAFEPMIRNAIGSRVTVPLGLQKKPVMGIVLAVSTEKSIVQDVKPLLWIHDPLPLFDANYRSIITEMAVRYCLEEGVIYSQILPEPLVRVQGTLRYSAGSTIKSIALLELYTLPAQERATLYMQLCDGTATFLQEAPVCYDTYTVVQSPPWDIKRSAVRQKEILEFLWENGATQRTTLEKIFGKQSINIVRQLERRGIVGVRYAKDMKRDTILHRTQQYEHPSSVHNACVVRDSLCVRNEEEVVALPSLTLEQQESVNFLKQSIDTKQATTVLVHGVTGSGKSRVYTECVEYVLQQGKSALILVPEVALIKRIESFCMYALKNRAYCVYNGYQNSLTRSAIMQFLARTHEPLFIIGTRSALFLPVQNLGLIVMDEEHDASYKQDSGGILYSAKEIAWKRIQQCKGVLILGSATPDVKTYYATEVGAIQKVVLHKRATGAKLPTIHFIDMKNHRGALFAPETIEAIHETYAHKQQAIILLNRRGYAPHMYCTLCGTVQMCIHCAVSLMYHKKEGILRCPYCEYTTYFPAPCSACKGMSFLPLGIGTEKLEEALKELLPQGARVLRLDRDTGKSIESIEYTLHAFAKGGADVLVGTQMLSKGHDFPNVSLCVVADADVGLHFPDYRATERTFQLLVQTAGRAGRSQHKGRVFVQTWYTKHPCWTYIQENNYKDFYAAECAIREKRLYPPFTYIALIRFRFPKGSAECIRILTQLRQILQKKITEYNITILGPVPSPRSVVNNVQRYQCLVKSDSWAAIRGFYMCVEQYIRPIKNLKAFLDIDPTSML